MFRLPSSSSHSEKCISANRFGDGFDCCCDPDPKLRITELESQVAALKMDLQKTEAAVITKAEQMGVEYRRAEAAESAVTAARELFGRWMTTDYCMGVLPPVLDTEAWMNRYPDPNKVVQTSSLCIHFGEIASCTIECSACGTECRLHDHKGCDEFIDPEED